MIHVTCPDRQHAAGHKTEEADPPHQVVARCRAPTGDRECGEQQHQRESLGLQLLVHDVLCYRANTTSAIVAKPVKMATTTVQGMVIRRTAPSWPFTPAMLVPSTMLAGAMALP